MNKYYLVAAFGLLSCAGLSQGYAQEDAGARRGSFARVCEEAQPKMVKIYGAGGFRGLEPYQSGVLISAEGHILTVWSYVLDSEVITVTLDDGRRYAATLLGADPRLEIAVLQVDAEGLPHYSLPDAIDLVPGDRVLAFSNLYRVAYGSEPTSVLHGSVQAVSKLQARRGAFKSPYNGDIYVLDAMTNNPGAAGGALTNRRGQFAGLLGKELRNSQNNTWLNYALPIRELTGAVEDIIAGRVRPRSESENVKLAEDPLSLRLLGIHLVPEVLPKTPPFVDRIVPDSVAAKAGLKPDDLILFLNDRMTGSAKAIRDELNLVDRYDSIRVVVQRDQDLEEYELKLGD